MSLSTSNFVSAREFLVHLEFVRSSKKYDNLTKIARCTNTQTQVRVAGRRARRPRVFVCLCVRVVVFVYGDLVVLECGSRGSRVVCCVDS